MRLGLSEEFRSRNYVNLIYIEKQPQLQSLDRAAALGPCYAQVQGSGGLAPHPLTDEAPTKRRPTCTSESPGS
jgi:hypothetical protein